MVYFCPGEYQLIVMTKIASSILDLVGHTPLVRLSRIEAAEHLPVRLLAKVESFNPAGSAKDRVALQMVEEAERDGRLRPGATIIEPTSGNTGVGLALVSALKGYHLILTMPDTMSPERRKLVAGYGAEVVLTPGAQGMKGAIGRAEALRDSIPGAIILQQFENPANPLAHYLTTGEEIWQDTEGRVDAFVAGIGTGGTICGTARRLKEYNKEIRIVGMEPASSAFLTTGKAGAHKIQGIGAGFVPGIYDASLVDEVLAVADDEAFEWGRRLAREEGILAGISSGAALRAAVELARRPGMDGKTIVVLLPDTGERYLSTELFA